MFALYSVFLYCCGHHRDLPSFPTRRSSDLNDASAKELARTAQTTAETVATDHNGDYSTDRKSTRHDASHVIPSYAGYSVKKSKASGTTTGYTVTTTAVPTGNTFTITYAAGV